MQEPEPDRRNTVRGIWRKISFITKLLGVVLVSTWLNSSVSLQEPRYPLLLSYQRAEATLVAVSPCISVAEIIRRSLERSKIPDRKSRGAERGFIRIGICYFRAQAKASAVVRSA